MDAQRNEFSNRKSVVLVTTLGSFLIPLMASSVNIALPSLGKEFGMDAILLSWVTSSYILAVAIFQVPFGRVADIYGRKRVFLWGYVIFTVSSLFLAFAPSSAALVGLRIVQGLGASMAFSTMMAILTSVFPPGQRGKALGINVAAVYSGLSCGPFIGGLLTYQVGWRSVFFMNVPLGLFIILVTLWKLKGEWKEAMGETFDVPVALVYSAMLVALMYGFSQLPQTQGVVFLILGILGFFLFVRWEARNPSPIVDVNLFRNNRVFALSNLAALINYSATFAVSFLLSLYLQVVRGMNPQEAGVILISQPIVQAVFSPFTGWLSDRIEPRMLASVGMALSATGLFLLIFLGEQTAIPSIVGCLIVLGGGFGLFSSPNTNAVMSSVDKRFYGVASGTVGTMRSTGMMFSMGVTMLIFGLTMGRTPLTTVPVSLMIRSMKISFIVFTGLCCAGILASLSRGKLR